MFLLQFVNKVRRAQRCEPLQTLEIGYLPALEDALGCRIDERAMRFGDPQVAREVAAGAGLPLGRTADTVELPPAVQGYLTHCAVG